MLIRLAIGLVRNPLPEHRWRRVAVPVTAAIALLLVLPDTACRADAPFALQPETDQRLAEILRVPAGAFRLAARDDIAAKGVGDRDR